MPMRLSDFFNGTRANLWRGITADKRYMFGVRMNEVQVSDAGAAAHAASNAIHGHAAECGLVSPKGLCLVKPLLARAAGDDGVLDLGSGPIKWLAVAAVMIRCSVASRFLWTAVRRRALELRRFRRCPRLSHIRSACYARPIRRSVSLRLSSASLIPQAFRLNHWP